MQALDVLRRHAQHQARFFRTLADLHRHHTLPGANDHGRQHLGADAVCPMQALLALLPAPEHPGQRCQRADHEEQRQQRRGPAHVIHG